MHKNPLYELYEKQYFHEIEVREKLNGRLSMPLGIFVSLVGAVAFLLQNFDRQATSPTALIFLVALFLAAATICGSAYFFVKSWWNISYSIMPNAIETEDYRKLLEDTYLPHGDEGKELSERYLYDYLCSYYVKAAGKNATQNDLRSLGLHRTNGFLILSTALVALCFLFFYFGELDKGRHTKPTEVHVVKPVEVKGLTMNDQKQEQAKLPSAPPPAPPTPPPMREIREGVKISPPAKEK